MKRVLVKPVVIVLLALGAASGAAACGGDDEGDKQPPPPQAAKRPVDRDRREVERQRKRRRREQERAPTPKKKESRAADSEPSRTTDSEPGDDQRPAQERHSPSSVRGPGSRPQQRLERYLRERFGGGRGPKASWYDHIEAVEVSNGRTTLRTDLGTADAKLADEICSSVRGSLPGITDVVRVTGPPDDKVLAECVP